MKCKVYMTLYVDEEANILPVSEDMYEEVVTEMIEDVIYDIDGAEIKHIEVKQIRVTNYQQTIKHSFTSHGMLNTLTVKAVSHGAAQ